MNVVLVAVFFFGAFSSVFFMKIIIYLDVPSVVHQIASTYRGILFRGFQQKVVLARLLPAMLVFSVIPLVSSYLVVLSCSRYFCR